VQKNRGNALREEYPLEGSRIEWSSLCI